MNCDKPVRCYDYLTRPCLREQDHEGGCNPFSNTPPLTGEKKDATQNKKNQQD